MREFEVKVKSLEKALEVLNCFVEKQPRGNRNQRKVRTI